MLEAGGAPPARADPDHPREIAMPQLIRIAVLASVAAVPATAFAQFWLPFSPALPEENARMIAAMHGVVLVVDASPTIDSDWLIEGNNFYGQEIEMVIDGTTGAVERMEIED
jgi:hypothetical protein